MLWTIHGLKMLEQTGLRDHKYVCVRSDNQPCARSSKPIVLVYFGFATLTEPCSCTVEEFLPGWSIGNFWGAQTAISKRKEKHEKKRPEYWNTMKYLWLNDHHFVQCNIELPLRNPQFSWSHDVRKETNQRNPVLAAKMNTFNENQLLKNVRRSKWLTMCRTELKGAEATKFVPEYWFKHWTHAVSQRPLIFIIIKSFHTHHIAKSEKTKKGGKAHKESSSRKHNQKAPEDMSDWKCENIRFCTSILGWWQ